LDGFVKAFRELCDELRCWDTEPLRVERERVMREQRKLRACELALTCVLDERDALAKDQAARDGETESQSQRKRRTAKKLEELPNLGRAALNGDLSQDQLDPAADLADEDSDAEITEKAKRTSPLDLQRMARERRRTGPARSCPRNADEPSSAGTGDVDGRVATAASDSRSTTSTHRYGAEPTTRRTSRRCAPITTAC
jgi:hypothetical protein